MKAFRRRKKIEVGKLCRTPPPLPPPPPPPTLSDFLSADAAFNGWRSSSKAFCPPKQTSWRRPCVVCTFILTINSFCFRTSYTHSFGNYYSPPRHNMELVIMVSKSIWPTTFLLINDHATMHSRMNGTRCILVSFKSSWLKCSSTLNSIRLHYDYCLNSTSNL